MGAEGVEVSKELDWASIGIVGALACRLWEGRLCLYTFILVEFRTLKMEPATQKLITDCPKDLWAPVVKGLWSKF